MVISWSWEKVKKGKESSFQNVKHMRATGIYVPQGCKATLYNERHHFAAHLTGPKNYCSTGQLDGIDIVGLQDVADVAVVAGELAKAEDTIKGLSEDVKELKQNITGEVNAKVNVVRDTLLRKNRANTANTRPNRTTWFARIVCDWRNWCGWAKRFAWLYRDDRR